jgi:hypothetical protein
MIPSPVARVLLTAALVSLVPVMVAGQASRTSEGPGAQPVAPRTPPAKAPVQTPRPAPGPTPRPAPRTRPVTPAASRPAGPLGRSWSGLVRYGNAYDSNIDQNDANLQAFGVVLGGGLRYVDDPRDPSVTVQYETGIHRYSGTDRWDRISHYVRAQASQDLVGRLKGDLIGEISLKGTTEEREMSNQFNVIPRLNLRLDKRHRVRVVGAWRERRYDDVDRNARNRYIGAEFTRKDSDDHELTVEARIERNDAQGSRYQWNRISYGAEYLWPLGKWGRLEFDVRYRQVRYAERTVEIDDEDVLRRDNRWTPAIVWRHDVTPLTELRLGFQRESRDSNDPRRDFGANQFIFGLTRRF